MNSRYGPNELERLRTRIKWARQRGFADSPLGNSLIRALVASPGDRSLQTLISEQIEEIEWHEALGAPPFPEPHGLRVGELTLGFSHLGRQLRTPFETSAASMLLMMPSGNGKSSALRTYLPTLAAHGVAVWIWDRAKPESRHLAPFFPDGSRGLATIRPETNLYEPMHPGDADHRGFIPHIAEVVSQGWGLGERSKTVLHQVFHSQYERYERDAHPNLFDIYEEVKSRSDIPPVVRKSILDRMSPMLLYMNPMRLGWSPADLARCNLCWEMAAAPETLGQVLSEALIYSVFQAEMEKGAVSAPLHLVVVFEDAQAYAQPDFSGKMTLLERVAGTVRSAGIGVIVTCQTMEGLSRKLIPNLSGLKLAGAPGSNDDAWRIGKDMRMRDRDQIDWMKLHTGRGTYVGSSYLCQEPFVLHMPFIPIQHHVSDAEADNSVKLLSHLKTVRATEYNDWKPHYVVRIRSHDRDSDSSEASGSGRPTRKPLDKEQLDYLEHVVSSPFLNATQRDSELRLSSSKGHRIRKTLVEREFVRSVSVNPGGRGRAFQLLEVTKKGRAVLKGYGVKIPKGRGRGGVEHQYWAYTIAKWIETRGQGTAIEDESGEARVDVVFEGASGDVAVEIEVSPGHEVENIRKDIAAGFAHIVCLIGRADAVDKARAEFVSRFGADWEDRVRIGFLSNYAEILEELLVSSSDERRNERKK